MWKGAQSKAALQIIKDKPRIRGEAPWAARGPACLGYEAPRRERMAACAVAKEMLATLELDCSQ